MKIVAISDLHMQYDDITLPKGDMLMCAGDFTWQGTVAEMQKTADWWNSLNFKYKVLTYGNHEVGPEKNLEFFKPLFKDTHVLIHESVEIEGIKIFGSPYTPNFGRWAFMRSETELHRLYEQIPDDTNIILSHGPAYCILDKVPDGKHVGSKPLLYRINELKQLKYHICGHIHCSYGKEVVNGVTFVNAAIVGEDYKVTNAPQILMYNTESK